LVSPREAIIAELPATLQSACRIAVPSTDARSVWLTRFARLIEPGRRYSASGVELAAGGSIPNELARLAINP